MYGTLLLVAIAAKRNNHTENWSRAYLTTGHLSPSHGSLGTPYPPLYTSDLVTTPAHAPFKQAICSQRGFADTNTILLRLCQSKEFHLFSSKFRYRVQEKYFCLTPPVLSQLREVLPMRIALFWNYGNFFKAVAAFLVKTPLFISRALCNNIYCFKSATINRIHFHNHPRGKSDYTVICI